MWKKTVQKMVKIALKLEDKNRTLERYFVYFTWNKFWNVGANDWLTEHSS